MHSELEKIDVLRERMGISYREAQEALQESEGDLVAALVKAEEAKGQGWTGELLDKSGELAEHVKQYVSRSNRTRVRLKRGDRTIAEFPATVGFLGIAAALMNIQLAVVAGIGMVAAAANSVFLEIEKPNGETRVIKY